MWVDISRLGPAARMQILQKLGQEAQKTGSSSKYHAVKDTRISGEKTIRFDSKAEARRYDELMLMLKTGTIRDLRLQPEYTLVEAYTTPDGKRVRAERYRADFSYRIRFDGRKEWALVVEDVKSRATQTAIYRSKKKRMLEIYGIDVKEVT